MARIAGPAAGLHGLQLAQQSESLFVSVLANHSVQVWVKICQRDDQQRGQTSQEPPLRQRKVWPRSPTAVVQPDAMADDLGRKPEPFIRRAFSGHDRRSCPTSPSRLTNLMYASGSGR